MSPPWAKWTTDAALAGLDRAALVAGGAEGVAEGDACALRGFLEGRARGFGVDGFRGGVADDVELAAAGPPPARAGAVVTAAATGGEDGDEQGEKRDREADLHAAPPGSASVPHRIGSFLS